MNRIVSLAINWQVIAMLMAVVCGPVTAQNVTGPPATSAVPSDAPLQEVIVTG